MRPPHADRIEHGAVAANDAAFLKPLQPRLNRTFRQTDPPRQFRDRDAPLTAQNLQDRLIIAIQIAPFQSHRKLPDLQAICLPSLHLRAK